MTLWAGRLTPAASVLVVHSMLIAPYKARWREREIRWVTLRGRGRGRGKEEEEEEEKKRKRWVRLRGRGRGRGKEEEKKRKRRGN